MITYSSNDFSGSFLAATALQGCTLLATTFGISGMFLGGVKNPAQAVAANRYAVAALFAGLAFR